MNVFDNALITVLAPQFAVFTFRQFGIEVHGLAVAASDGDAIEPPKERHGLMPPWNLVYWDFDLETCLRKGNAFSLPEWRDLSTGRPFTRKQPRLFAYWRRDAASLVLAQQRFRQFP